MAQYLVSVWHDEEYEIDFSSDDAQRQVAQVEQFNRDLADAGAFVFAGGLMPSSSAHVMKFGAGDVMTTDGPYAESKEHIGGFWVIETADAASAEEWARKAAAACENDVELRPFHSE